MQNLNDSDFSDEAEVESDEQLLARFYDTSYLLQARGFADINIVQTDDEKTLIVVVLSGVLYDKEEGFIKE